jgi:hypothetical protein
MPSKAAQTPDAAQNLRSDPNMSGSQATLAVSRIVPGRRVPSAVSAGAEGDCTSSQVYVGPPILQETDG